MTDRKPGLSGLVRLRNEEVWAKLALESFVDWCDELVIVVNGSTDNTQEIALDFQMKHKQKAAVYLYPHEIWPMGPGHDDIPASDKRSSAALYNYTQSKSTRTHVCKLDGDMVMMDGAGAVIRALMDGGHNRIKFYGTDIVGDALTHVGNHPHCPTNGVYLAEHTHYAQGPMTQSLRNAPDPTAELADPAFLHFKWARKSFESATVQWPYDWQDQEHFQQIANRRHPVEPYNGEYPASVRALL